MFYNEINKIIVHYMISHLFKRDTFKFFVIIVYCQNRANRSYGSTEFAANISNRNPSTCIEGGVREKRRERK